MKRGCGREEAATKKRLKPVNEPDIDKTVATALCQSQAVVAAAVEEVVAEGRYGEKITEKRSLRRRWYTSTSG